MPTTTKKNLKPLNPIWTIWVPLSTAILVILAAAGLAIFGAARGEATINQWGAISLILVILPSLLLGLVLLVIIILLAISSQKLTESMSRWLHTAQALVYAACLRLLRFSDSLAEPAIKQSSRAAGLKAIIPYIRSQLRRDR